MANERKKMQNLVILFMWFCGSVDHLQSDFNDDSPRMRCVNICGNGRLEQLPQRHTIIAKLLIRSHIITAAMM